MYSPEQDGRGESSLPWCANPVRAARSHTLSSRSFQQAESAKMQGAGNSQTKERFSGTRKRAYTGADTQTHERAEARWGGWGAATEGARLRRKTLCRWGVL